MRPRAEGQVSRSRPTRALMGLAAASFSTFIALFSHVAAGGAMPAALGIIGPLVFSTLACVLFAGIRFSLLRLSLSVVVSQFLFHSMFILGASGSPAGPAQSGHAAHDLPSAVIALDGSAAMPMDQTAAVGGWMWVAHLVAAVITVAVLHRSEAIVRHLTAFTEFVVASLVSAITVEVAPPRRVRGLGAFSRDALLVPLGIFPSTLSQRGPPAAFGL